MSTAIAKKPPQPVGPIAKVEKDILKEIGILEGALNLLREHRVKIDECLSVESYVWFSNISRPSFTFNHPHDAIQLTRVLGGRWERVRHDATWYKYHGVTRDGFECTIHEAELLPRPEKLCLGDDAPTAAPAEVITNIGEVS